ncbi:MAG: hypothetical protein ABI821_06570 [Pseudomonadota bacterium]
MNLRTLSAAVLTTCVVLCSAVHAREGNTWQDEFRIYSTDIATQCASVQDQLKTFVVESEPLTGYTLKDAVQSLCVCIPAKLEGLKGKLSPLDLQKPVSEDEVLKLFNPGVIDRCAAEQMHTMYAEDCPKRFKQADLDVPHYCACMKEVMSNYSDAETAAVAAAAQDYLPLAAAAEQNNLPIPTRPPILEAYFRADQNCKGVWKAFEGLKP